MTLNPPCQAPSLSTVCHVAEQNSWEGFSPSQLLSPLEAQHMGTQELNRRLTWSYYTVSPGSFQPRLVSALFPLLSVPWEFPVLPMLSSTLSDACLFLLLGNDTAFLSCGMLNAGWIRAAATRALIYGLQRREVFDALCSFLSVADTTGCAESLLQEQFPPAAGQEQHSSLCDSP